MKVHALLLLPATLLPACSAGGVSQTQPRAAFRPAPVATCFALSDASKVALEDAPEVTSELEAVLMEYFGAPGAPKLNDLDEWGGGDFGAHGSPFDVKRPSLEAEGITLQSLRADNERLWAAEIEAVRAGEFENLGPWRGRRTMSANWEDLREKGIDAQKAEAFFVERYPDLAEAAEMFRAYCAPCHGYEGGGNGPMANRFYPRPRNYRAGTFKFAGTLNTPKPRRTDLLKTLTHGLPGSAMPSFKRLSTAERSSLVDFIRLLAIRGELEAMLVDEWVDDEVPPREAAKELYELIWERWLAVEEKGVTVIAPEPDSDPARWRLGRDVFLDPGRGNCFSCHGPEGKGDGEKALRVDEDGRRFLLLKDEWGQFIFPRDFSEGVFRGGDRREDIYLRMHCGIGGTPMPSVGGSRKANGEPLLSANEAWAVVDFVLSLSGKGPLATAAQ